MKCPHCAHEIPAGATVCGTCGAYEEERVSGWLSLPYFVCAIAITLGIFIIGAVISFSTGRYLPIIVGFLLACAAPSIVAMIFPKKKVWLHKR